MGKTCGKFFCGTSHDWGSRIFPNSWLGKFLAVTVNHLQEHGLKDVSPSHSSMIFLNPRRFLPGPWIFHPQTPCLNPCRAPGSWHDDGAPWRLHQGRGPLRCELLRAQPRRVEGHGSTAAAAVGGHLPILPRLREAGPTKVINIYTKTKTILCKDLLKTLKKSKVLLETWW